MYYIYNLFVNVLKLQSFGKELTCNGGTKISQVSLNFLICGYGTK